MLSSSHCLLEQLRRCHSSVGDNVTDMGKAITKFSLNPHPQSKRKSIHDGLLIRDGSHNWV